MNGARLLPLALAASALCTVCARERAGPTLLDDVSVAPRGHQELRLRSAAPPEPLVVGREEPLGICLEAPPERDTSQWQARLWFDGRERPADVHPPAVRLGSTLCFDAALPPGPLGEDLSLCGELRDGFDGATAPIPCMRFGIEEDAAPRAALMSSMRGILSRRERSTPAELVASLDELAARARSGSYPLAALRMDLIASYMLRRAGTPENLREAEARLAAAPPWLDEPAAASWAAQADYERATLALASGRLEPAWTHLRNAEARYARVADPKLVTVVMKESEILARAGAVEEACRRLRLAIERCADAPCEPVLVPAAENTLAWLLLQDPDADDASLREAEALLERARSGPDPAKDPLEGANVVINVAYARTRRHEDPGPVLSEARRLLASAGPGGVARAEWLSGWLRLVEGERALDEGRSERAMGVCLAVAEGCESAILAARAWSCASRALERQGRRDEAAGALRKAIFLHEHFASRGLGQSIALGPGQRADDYYRAARLEIDRGRPQVAWTILRDLDGLLAREDANLDCAGPPDDQTDRERDALLLRLVALEAPAPGARRAQREAIRVSLMESLQEMERRRPACESGRVQGPPRPADRGDTRDAARSDDVGVMFRAFPLADEILVLGLSATGETHLYRRTRFPRKDLLRTTQKIRLSLDAHEPAGGRGWDALVEPLACALVPDPTDLREVTTFALYGALQEVPLAALPLRHADASAPRFGRQENGVSTGGAPDRHWLGDATVVAYRPSGAVRLAASSPATGALPAVRSSAGADALFVVNPTGDLAAGAALGRFYRETFPRARVLEGPEATLDALRPRLSAAAWLHIDAHARYDPAFPELTELLLADGPVTARQLRTADSLQLANLSACGSGRWPVTADSGRFGLAGEFARRGAAWVVGTRADLPDALAADFNRAFYEELAGGAGIPQAYGHAVRRCRSSHPVTEWAALLLLQAEPPGGRGEDPAGRGGKATEAGLPSRRGAARSADPSLPHGGR